MSTTNTTEQQADLEKVVERIQKLLNLASKNPNEAEAASAAAKAQELLAAYNLDMATVEQGGSSSGKREDARVRGGMYAYERELWGAVARLNFCMYFTTRNRKWKNRGWSYTFQHRVVGRVVNTTSTKNMADYLQSTMERLCRERLAVRVGDGATPGELNSQFFTSWAVAFREGMADRIMSKLRERRDEAEAEREAQAAKKARAGTSTATALTLADVKDREHQANYDFMHGEGAWAKKEARNAEWEKKWDEDRAKQAAADAAAEAEYSRWAEANPEEARKEEAKARAKQRAADRRADRSANRRERAPSAREKRAETGGYWEGYDKGAEIGLDPQAESSRARGRLR